MKGIDIVVPISGWSSWYSTGGELLQCVMIKSIKGVVYE